MLRDAKVEAASSSTSPGLPLPSHWRLAQRPKDLESLPRLREAGASLLFTGSASSEAQHVSQKQTSIHSHMDTQAGHWHGQLHEPLQIRHCLQQHLHTGLT